MSPDDGDDPLPPGAEPAPVFNAGESEHIKNLKRRLANMAREDRELVEQLLGHPVGRRFLWKILSDLNAFEVVFPVSPGGVPDKFALYHAQGKRDAGLIFYHEWMALNPEGCMAMLREHHPLFPKPKVK